MIPGKRIHPTELILACQELSMLLAMPTPLAEALQSVAEESQDRRIKAALARLATQVRTGVDPMAAFRQYPALWRPQDLVLIQTSLAHHRLSAGFGAIANAWRGSDQLQQKLFTLTVYPILVLAMALMVTGLLLVWVAPTINDLYRSFGAGLPLISYWVFGLGEGPLGELAILVGLLLIGALFCPRCRRPVRERLTRLVPGFRTLDRELFLASFLTTVTDLMRLGATMESALRDAVQTTEHRVYQRQLAPMLAPALLPSRLFAAMNAPRIFPGHLVRFLERYVMESPSEVVLLLDGLADHHQQRARIRIEMVAAWLAPLLVVLTAVVVGTLLLAFYLPIFQMGSLLG